MRRNFLSLLAALALAAAPAAATPPTPMPDPGAEQPRGHHGNLALVYIGILALIPAIVLIGVALGVDTEEDSPTSP